MSNKHLGKRVEELGRIFKEVVDPDISEEDAQRIVIASAPINESPSKYIESVDDDSFRERVKNIFRRYHE